MCNSEKYSIYLKKLLSCIYFVYFNSLQFFDRFDLNILLFKYYFRCIYDDSVNKLETSGSLNAMRPNSVANWKKAIPSRMVQLKKKVDVKNFETFFEVERFF